MRTWILTLGVLFCGDVLAKSWNGIEPGVTRRDEVIKRFGDPSRALTADNKEVLAYLGVKAIKGTTQAQFRLDPKSGVVDRIDVFPAPVIDKETIEASYGPACGSGASGNAPLPCFTKKLRDDFQTYFLYARVGLAVFFNEDGKTVQSFSFQAPRAALEGDAR